MSTITLVLLTQTATLPVWFRRICLHRLLGWAERELVFAIQANFPDFLRGTNVYVHGSGDIGGDDTNNCQSDLLRETLLEIQP